VRGRVRARGRKARKREEGRWVITMEGIRPRRREREAEKMLPRVERNLPGVVSWRERVFFGRFGWVRWIGKGRGDAYHVALIMPPNFPLGRWNFRSR
jgi:hypothetical protein